MPLLDLFFSMIWFFLFFMWIMLVIRVFADIFRSDDLGGFSKVIWMLLVMFLPLFGVFVYVIARGGKMTERSIRDAQNQDAAFKSYVQEAAGTSSVADELTKLAQLRDNGTLSPEDYAAAKAKVLA
jgi:Short C-terminal domain